METDISIQALNMGEVLPIGSWTAIRRNGSTEHIVIRSDMAGGSGEIIVADRDVERLIRALQVVLSLRRDSSVPDDTGGRKNGKR